MLDQRSRETTKRTWKEKVRLSYIVYVCVCVCLCLCVCMCIHIYIYVCVCVHKHCLDTNIVSMHMCACDMCLDACMWIGTCIYVCAFMFVRVHTHTLLRCLAFSEMLLSQDCTHPTAEQESKRVTRPIALSWSPGRIDKTVQCLWRSRGLWGGG